MVIAVRFRRSSFIFQDLFIYLIHPTRGPWPSTLIHCEYLWVGKKKKKTNKAIAKANENFASQKPRMKINLNLAFNLHVNVICIYIFSIHTISRTSLLLSWSAVKIFSNLTYTIPLLIYTNIILTKSESSTNFKNSWHRTKNSWRELHALYAIFPLEMCIYKYFMGVRRYRSFDEVDWIWLSYLRYRPTEYLVSPPIPGPIKTWPICRLRWIGILTVMIWSNTKCVARFLAQLLLKLKRFKYFFF